MSSGNTKIPEALHRRTQRWLCSTICWVARGLLTEKISQAFCEATGGCSTCGHPTPPSTPKLQCWGHTSHLRHKRGRFERKNFASPIPASHPTLMLEGAGDLGMRCVIGGGVLLLHLSMTVGMRFPKACEIFSVTCLVSPCTSDFPHRRMVLQPFCFRCI